MKFAKVGIMGAMQEEITFLLHDMDNARETILGTGKGARSYWQGTLYGKNTTLAFSRYGKVASASTVTSLIDTEKVDLVLFTGVAGAVSSDLEIGDPTRTSRVNVRFIAAVPPARQMPLGANRALLRLGPTGPQQSARLLPVAAAWLVWCSEGP